MKFITTKTISFLLLLALTAMFAIYITTAPLIRVTLSVAILDAAIECVLFILMVVALSAAIKFIKNLKVPVAFNYITYITLAVLFIAVWTGVWYIALWLLIPYDKLVLFWPIIPSRILVGLLLYAGIVIYFISKYNNIEQSEELEEISENPVKSNKTIEHVAVKSGQKIDLILIPNIIAITAEGDYVMIHTPKGKYMKEQTMKYFADNLPDGKFVRVHRSGIVNIEYISRVESYDARSQMIIMHNNLKVKASIAGYKQLKSVLNL